MAFYVKDKYGHHYICDEVKEYGSNPVRASLENYLTVKKKPSVEEVEIIKSVLTDRNALQGFLQMSLPLN